MAKIAALTRWKHDFQNCALGLALMATAAANGPSGPASMVGKSATTVFFALVALAQPETAKSAILTTRKYETSDYCFGAQPRRPEGLLVV